jgi:MoaA/NifB/PqqE/SkfB family radical SAM enzyme
MEKFIVQWHITHLCNLKCTHCYQEDFTKKTSKPEFYSILDKLDSFIDRKKFVPQINLTGGEPLIHPDFFEFAQEIRNRKFRLGILTNGTLINEEIDKTMEKVKANENYVLTEDKINKLKVALKQNLTKKFGEEVIVNIAVDEYFKKLK